MKWLVVIALSVSMFACGPTKIMIYEGPAGEEDKPIWTVVDPPDELVFERTKGEGESKETVKLVVKKEPGGFPNPFTYVAGVFSDVVALLFGTLGGVTPSVGK